MYGFPMGRKQIFMHTYTTIHTLLKVKNLFLFGSIFSFPSLERFPYKSEFPYRKGISPLGDPLQKSTLLAGNGFTSINSSF